MAMEFNDQNFEQEVIKNEGPVLVDFWAPWCGPCKMLGPVLEEIEKELGETVSFVKINVDENPVTSQTYSVSSIPTVLVFKGGTVVNRSVPPNTLWGYASAEPLAVVNIPLTPNTSYDSFLKGLRPIRKKTKLK